MNTAEIQFWPATDVGRVRKVNEDSFLVDKKLRLYIVCDGMGGHAAGEVASQLCARTIRDVLAERRDDLADYAAGGATTRKDLLRLMERSVEEACARVHQAGVDDESKRGMGTTADVLLLVGTRGFIAHVGDARVYLHRQGSTHQLTEDHSLINELLKRGKLTPAQIDKVQYKNAVTRAVGVYESVQVDTFDFDVLSGDRFLLCSDGLHGYLGEGELTKLFEKISPDKLTPHLIDLANERGGKDNITGITLQVGEAGEADARAAQINLKLAVLHKMAVFRTLTYQELVRVLNITAVVQYQPGSVIVREGEQADALFILLSGKATVTAGSTEVAQLTGGQHFGEMALVDKAPRNATVTAVEPSQLLVMRRRDFFDIVRKDHHVAVKLLWSVMGVLTQRLRSTTRELGIARDLLVDDEELDVSDLSTFNGFEAEDE